MAIEYREFKKALGDPRAAKTLEARIAKRESLRFTAAEMEDFLLGIASLDLSDGRFAEFRANADDLRKTRKARLKRARLADLGIEFTSDSNDSGPTTQGLPAGIALLVAAITVFAAAYKVGESIGAAVRDSGGKGDTETEYVVDVEGNDGDVVISTD